MYNSLPIEQNYYGWDGFQIKQGDLEIGVSPKIGGRIISLKYQDEELLFVNKEIAGKSIVFGDMSNLAQVKQKFGWRLFGGDKTWVAPQRFWIEGTPPLDLDAGVYEYELSDHAIMMKSPIDRETGLRIVRKVSLSSDGSLSLRQSFINESQKNVKCGIWDVTQMIRPFDVFLPVGREKVHPDMKFLASIKDQKLFVSNDDGWAKIQCRQMVEYKYGCKVFPGIVLAVRPKPLDTLVMVREFSVNTDAIYPDGNMVEIYNSGGQNYFELEILGPLVELAPGDQTSHSQTWKIKKLKGHPSFQEILEEFNIKS